MFSSKYGKCQSGSISATPSAEMNSVEMTFVIAVIPSSQECRQVDRRSIQGSSAGTPSAGCVTVVAGEGRDHLPGALEDPLVQLALDDRPHDRFLAFGILLAGHLAGPHPSGRAPQMR